MNDNLRSSWGMRQQMRVTAAAALVPVLGEGGGGRGRGASSRCIRPKLQVHEEVRGSWTGRGAPSQFTRVFCFSVGMGVRDSKPMSLHSTPGPDKGIVHRAVASGALDALIPMLRSPSGKEREVAAKVGKCVGVCGGGRAGALDALIPMLRSPSGKEREVAAKEGHCVRVGGGGGGQAPWFGSVWGRTCPFVLAGPSPLCVGRHAPFVLAGPFILAGPF